VDLTINPTPEPDTLPPDFPPATDTLACVVCGTGLTYKGRGPKPKYCDEHRPGPKRSTAPSSGKRSGQTIDGLVNQIGDFYRTIGFALTMAPNLAMDGMVVADQAQTMAESWRPVLENNATVRKWWEKTFTAGSYGVLIAAHAPVMLAIAQNHGIGPKIMKETTNHE
jgi:hypothetical protein